MPRGGAWNYGPARECELSSRGMVHLANETIAADTIILAAGVTPNPVLAGLPVAKDKRGCIVVEPTMRAQIMPKCGPLATAP